MSEGTPTLQSEKDSSSSIDRKLRPRIVLPVKRDDTHMSADTSVAGATTEPSTQKQPKKPRIYVSSKGSNHVHAPPPRPIQENDYVYGPNHVYRVVGESVFFNRFEGKHPHVLQLKNVLAKTYDCIYYPILPDDKQR